MKLVLAALVLILVAVAVVVWSPWKKSPPVSSPAVPVVAETSPPLPTRISHNVRRLPVQKDAAPATADQPATAVTPELTAPASTAAPTEPAEKSFRELFDSDTTQALAKVTLTGEQTQALQAFEANILPLVRLRLDESKAAAATAHIKLKAVAEARAASDQAAAQRNLAQFEEYRQKAFLIRLEIEKLYYDGLKKILTIDQLNQIPVPGSVRRLG